MEEQEERETEEIWFVYSHDCHSALESFWWKSRVVLEALFALAAHAIGN